MNKIKNLIVLIGTVTLLTGCVIGNQFGKNGQNVSVTLGNVGVQAGETAGHLETVNGNIEVEANTKIKSADTVNGNIYVGDDSQTRSLATVNGSIELGNNVIVDGKVQTVNGEVILGTGTSVSKDVQITNGDIILKARAIVSGNVVFDHTSFSSLFESKIDRTLEVDESAIIEGSIILYTPVELILPDNFDRSKIDNRYKGAK